MAEGKAGRKPRAAKVPLSPDELHTLLADFERALEQRDQELMGAVLGQLEKHRKQAADALVLRLSEGQARQPVIAFKLLQGLGGSRARTLLNRVASAPDAPGLTRLLARFYAGWAESREFGQRMAFLKSLRERDATLLEAVTLAMRLWPPDGELLREVYEHVMAIPFDERLALLERAVAERPGESVLLLYALLHCDDREAQLAAVRHIQAIHPVGSVAALERLARTATDEEVAAAARAALVDEQVFDAASGPPPDALEMAPLHTAWLSSLDGEGAQIGHIVRDLGGGVYTLVNFYWDSVEGLRDIQGRSMVSPEEIAQIDATLRAGQILLAPASLAEVRGALRLAFEATVEMQFPLLPEFELWEVHVHDAYPPAPDEEVTLPLLDDAPYRGRNELLRNAHTLLDDPAFQPWAFDPESTLAATQGVPPPKAVLLTEEQFRPLLEALLAGDERELRRQELRRQAWVLDRLGRERERDLTLALSAHLETATIEELSKLRFWQIMVEKGLGAAALAMLPPDAGLGAY